MFILMVVLFLLGYLAIALEHPIKVEKAASALLLGSILWAVYALFSDQILAMGFSPSWEELKMMGQQILNNIAPAMTSDQFATSPFRETVELTGHTIVNYIGNYDYYIEKKDILTPKALTDATAAINDSMAPSACQTPSSAQGSSKAEWQQSKEEAARLKKLKNELKRTEDKISQTEERISAIDEEYNNPDIASDTAKLVELHNERTSLSEMLDELYEKLKNNEMETNTQLEALNNALIYFGFKNVTLHEKQYSDKRKKVSKFFLQQGAETISPVLDYNGMNHFILGMGTMQKLTIKK